jgi:hypothetical protein
MFLQIKLIMTAILFSVQSHALTLNDFVGCYEIKRLTTQDVIQDPTSPTRIYFSEEARYFSELSGAPIKTIRMDAPITHPNGDYVHVVEMLMGNAKEQSLQNGVKLIFKQTVFNKLSESEYEAGDSLTLTRDANGLVKQVKVQIDCNCGETNILKPVKCN